MYGIDYFPGVCQGKAWLHHKGRGGRVERLAMWEGWQGGEGGEVERVGSLQGVH